MTELEKVRSQMTAPQPDEEALKDYPIEHWEKLAVSTSLGQTDLYFYKPLPPQEGNQELLPMLVNFHGGGFVKGYQAKCITFGHILASKGNCLVFDVDYKLAPEYPYPYAMKEGLEVVRYLRRHAGDFGGDPNRMVLCGESSGGNLAAVIAMNMKKEGDALPSGVICCYAPFDLDQDPAIKAQSKGIPLSDFILQGRMYNEWYAGTGHAKDIYVSPVFAKMEDLERLPPFTIIAGGDDFMCSDSMTFASLLMEAGVTVTVKKVVGAQHGFLVRRTDGFEEGDRVLFHAMKEYFAVC